MAVKKISNAHGAVDGQTGDKKFQEDVYKRQECEFMSWQKPSKEKCPNCGSYMVEKGNKLVCSNETCGFVKKIQEEEPIKA